MLAHVRSAQNAGKNNGIDTLELHMVALEEALRACLGFFAWF